jgi:1-acyl-sn-glycerol-3-phosphate acyltransferase
LAYHILKILVVIARSIFCRKILISKPSILKEEGPFILACNHPNSYLDAMILDTLFDKPLWSLTRGDMFKGRRIRRLLTTLKMLPVYRVSEGVENLQENYKTFEDCMKLFRNNAAVLIFSEGKSINEWRLRPLKKGTARLAIQCMQDNIPIKVIPVGINYSCFRRFGKNVFLNVGNTLTYPDLNYNGPDGLKHQHFNNKLRTELSQLVYEIPKGNRQLQKEKLYLKVPLLKKILLAIPAAIGWLIHAPLYLPVKRYTWKRTNHNDHFDSILITILFFLYPFYILLISLVLFFIIKSWLSFLLFLILPFCVWSYVQLKPQLDK